MNQASPGNSPTNWDDYKNLLFVDQSLEEMTKHYNSADDEFGQAYKYVSEGQPEKAKAILKKALSDPKKEVRYRLWAWNGLRQLGEKPPSKVANEVRGVVLEVPINNSVDTIAAYSDGRARYVSGKGGAIIWEFTEETNISPFVRRFINSAKPLVEKAPLFNKHRSTEQNIIRVSILTYSGVRIIEARQESDLTENPALSSVLDAGTDLFHALFDENEKSKQKAEGNGATH